MGIYALSGEYSGDSFWGARMGGAGGQWRREAGGKFLQISMGLTPHCRAMRHCLDFDLMTTEADCSSGASLPTGVSLPTSLTAVAYVAVVSQAGLR